MNSRCVATANALPGFLLSTLLRSSGTMTPRDCRGKMPDNRRLATGDIRGNDDHGGRAQRRYRHRTTAVLDPAWGGDADAEPARGAQRPVAGDDACARAHDRGLRCRRHRQGTSRHGGRHGLLRRRQRQGHGGSPPRRGPEPGRALSDHAGETPRHRRRALRAAQADGGGPSRPGGGGGPRHRARVRYQGGGGDARSRARAMSAWA